MTSPITGDNPAPSDWPSRSLPEIPARAIKSLSMPARWHMHTQMPNWLPVPVLITGSLILIYLAVCAVRVPLSLVLGAGPLVVVGVPLYLIDRYMVRPRNMRLAAVLWGASVSVCLAGVLEAPVGLGTHSILTLSFVAGPAEELAMLTGLWWLSRRLDVVSTLDAVMLISWVALGFAAVEDVGYFAVAPHHPLVATFLARAVATPFAHPLFSSMAAVGYVAYRRRGNIWWLWGGLGAAALAHTTWDGVIGWVAENTGNVSKATIVSVMVAYLGVFFGLFVTWLVLILVRRSREGRTLGFRLPHVVQYAGLPAFLGVVLSSGPRTRQYRATLSKEARGGFDEVTDTLISIARRDVDDPLEPLLAREAYFSYQRWASQLGAPPPVAEHRVSRIVTVEPPAPDATTLLRGEPQAPDPTTRLDGAGTPAKSPKILVVDNYDSFVYNIVQYLAELGASVEVARNDKVSADDLAKMAVDGVLISPGPGYPRDAGNCIAIIRYCYEHHIPMLGVCLGHQALGEAFGGVVSPAPQLMHGKASLIEHDDRGIFSGTPSPLIGGRYHSLAVEFPSLPECFLVTASCEGIIMGIRHRSAPLEGVQFHPESVLTQSGYRLLANWLAECGSPDAVARSAALDEKFGEMRKQLPGGGIV